MKRWQREWRRIVFTVALLIGLPILSIIYVVLWLFEDLSKEEAKEMEGWLEE